MSMPSGRCDDYNVESQLDGGEGISPTDALDRDPYRAEGPIQYKRGKYSLKKDQWIRGYCVLECGSLRILDESCDREIICVDVQNVSVFTSTYRVIRGSEGLGAQWDVLQGVFAFSYNSKQTMKIRVFGEEDVDYWTESLSNVFKKPLSFGRTGQTLQQDSVDGSRCHPFVIGQFSAPQSQPRPCDENAKSHSFSCSTSKECSALQTAGQISLRGDFDSRGQLADEFVDALNRTDSMLQGREVVLRSQLEGTHPDDVMAILSTVVASLSDPSEFSQLSSSALLSSAIDHRSSSHGDRSAAPSVVTVKRGSQKRNEETQSVMSTVINSKRKTLQTIVDDRCQTEDYRPSKKQEKVGAVPGKSSKCSEARYTSSLVIHLAPRRSCQNFMASTCGHCCCHGAPPTHSSWTVLRNEPVYVSSVSNSGVDSSSTELGLPRFVPPPRLLDRSMALFKKSLGKLVPRAPPPPPPPPPTPNSFQNVASEGLSRCSKGTAGDATKSGQLPSSFLAELRAAAMKRQISLDAKSKMGMM